MQQLDRQAVVSGVDLTVLDLVCLVCLFVCLFLSFVLFFEIGFLCVALAVLEFTL